MPSPFAVLGIDAAWTERAPSGVALVEVRGTRARAVAAAPSYASFTAGAAVDWTARASGGLCDAGALLASASRLTDLPVRCVAVDMALAIAPITRRRAADDAISSAFGRQWCGTHSPSAERPGRVSDSLRHGFEDLGFRLAVQAERLAPRSLVEVHPHAALLRLTRAEKRLPYKLARLRQYHPDATRDERLELMRATWRRIADALEREVQGTRALLPMPRLSTLPLARLKGVEDALDAIVCGWIGAEVMRGRAQPYGDATAAIWVPSGRVDPDSCPSS
jgi:predicted RNase H-like nuclease